MDAVIYVGSGIWDFEDLMHCLHHKQLTPPLYAIGLDMNNNAFSFKAFLAFCYL